MTGAACREGVRKLIQCPREPRNARWRPPRKAQPEAEVVRAGLRARMGWAGPESRAASSSLRWPAQPIPVAMGIESSDERQAPPAAEPDGEGYCSSEVRFAPSRSYCAVTVSHDLEIRNACKVTNVPGHQSGVLDASRCADEQIERSNGPSLTA